MLDVKSAIQFLAPWISEQYQEELVAELRHLADEKQSEA